MSTAIGAVRSGLIPEVWVLVALLLTVPASMGAQQTVTLPGPTTDWLGFHWGVRDPMEPEVERRLPVVRAVFQCSPAHLAGLEPGDLLVAVNGEDARRPRPFGGPLGSEYDVVLDRAGERLTVKLVRTTRPEEVGEPVTKAPMGSPAEWKCPDTTP